jgi:hypothetical protein
MHSFIENTAHYIVMNHKDSYLSWCYIFPNKRTNYYFRKALASKSGKINRAPRMIDISSFIKQLTGLTEIDDLSLVFELYKIFIQCFENDQISFDKFFKLGEIIISDFNEIDSWLVDPYQIYKNIENLSEIEEDFSWLTNDQKRIIREFWMNFSQDIKSKEKELFLQVRTKLPQVHTLLKKVLLEKKTGYRGLIYRYLSELIENREGINDDNEMYVFIGFNALNNSELNLFKYFKKNKKALFYWNTDAYYHNDIKHEAGFFLRKNFNELNIPNITERSRFEESKNIRVYGIPQNTGQAKIIPQILNNFISNGTISNTALVLADENNLFPILNSLPEYIGDINVSMGVPIKNTPLKQLIRLISEMYLSYSIHERTSIYFKFVIRLLKHPYIKSFDNISSSRVLDEIMKGKIIFIPHHKLKIHNPLYEQLFEKPSKTIDSLYFLDKLLNILFLIFDRKDKESPELKSLKNEYIFTTYKKIKKLRELLELHQIEISLKLTVHYLNHLLNNEKIPFEGNMDKGMQVIGIMETRNLAFKNLIITGFNEGNFPGSHQKPTFISESLRLAFGLPIFQHRDAVFAYIFYSLIQQAENIVILYNNLSNDRNSGEMSRFVLQLMYESKFGIDVVQIPETIKIPEVRRIIIQKTPALQKKLNAFLIQSNGFSEKMISPACINSYLDCSLRFYFSYISDLKELKTTDEEFTPGLTGNLLHIVMKNLYTVFIDKYVGKSDIENLYTLVGDNIDIVIKEYFNLTKTDPLNGNQILLKTVLTGYIEMILKNDANYAPFKIIALESNQFKTQFSFIFNGKEALVNLSGGIDRIDEKDNVIRIMDYKTGKTDSKVETIHDLFKMNDEKRSKHIFQILFYSYLYRQNHKKGVKLKPVLYYLRSMNDEYFEDSIKVQFPGNEKTSIHPDNIDEILDIFSEGLMELLNEMFSSETVFEQTNHTISCKFCIYKKICNRTE